MAGGTFPGGDAVRQSLPEALRAAFPGPEGTPWMGVAHESEEGRLQPGVPADHLQLAGFAQLAGVEVKECFSLKSGVKAG